MGNDNKGFDCTVSALAGFSAVASLFILQSSPSQGFAISITACCIASQFNNITHAPLKTLSVVAVGALLASPLSAKADDHPIFDIQNIINQAYKIP